MGDKIVFTPQQQAAIETRGSALLVSAAAGSGKTRVLVERLMAYLTDPEHPHAITDFLVITYTKAAAAELRGKISDAVAGRLALDPMNRALRRQLNLCACAEIGTIHGFCTHIVRENAHLLGIAPDFRVAEESECALLKDRVLEDVLEARYAQIESAPDFACLADTMAAGRDDRRLAEITLDIHARLQSFPYPEKWIEKQLCQLDFDPGADAGLTVWGAYLLERAKRNTAYWQAYMDELLRDALEQPAFYEKYGPAMEAWRGCISAFSAALARGWDEAAACVFDCPKAKPAKGFEDLKERFKKCKAGMAKTAECFDCTSARALGDLASTAPAIRALMLLVSDFDRAYAAEKKRRGLVDFSDLEHFAVRLLTDRETGAPTALAQEISGRYAEIMVDEYQDVNEVQDTVFRAVSREGRNIFMVGDVKQSIYRFRLADPTIFLDKYARYSKTQDEGKCIVLSRNFRSRPGILDGVNFFFRNAMSAAFGEMDYTEREYLCPGLCADDLPAPEPEIELDVLDLGAGDGDEETPDKIQAEAEWIAGRILELKKTLRLPDGSGGTRAADFGDFTILMRAVRDKLPTYTKALAARGIPVSADKGSRFFETAEISGMISLLTVIDNPRQDIPLISVLRSPLFGFTADELGSIRLCAPEDDFYTALTAAGQSSEKCRAFMERLAGFRSAAEDMTADRLIWHVYNTTGALGIYGAMAGGGTRRENLLLLAETARTYEQSGYKGLYQFITYLRQLMQRGDVPADVPAPQQPNAVQITTIHRSKGLEYPVVFIAGMAQKFNKMDLRKPLLFHAQLGVGPKAMDRALSVQTPTIARDAVAACGQSEMLSEELRVLYVAMTRAKEKLVMTCAYREAEKKLDKFRADAAQPLPPQVLEGAQSMAEWVLLAALTRPEAGRMTDPENAGPLTPGCWDMRIVRPEKADAPADAAPVLRSALPETADELPAAADIARRLAFRYPHARAVNIPSKLTATELKGRETDEEAAQQAQPAFAPARAAEYRRPDFAAARKLTPAERGTAVHLALQFIRPEQAAACGVRQELQRLLQEGILTGRQLEAVDPLMLERFYRSDLGRRVAQAADVHREFKFSLLVDAGRFLAGGDGEQVLLQGVVDCFFEEDGQLVLLDFKTDRVRAGEEEAAAAGYREQLEAYAYALRRITGKPVREKAVFFLRTGCAVYMQDRKFF